MSWFGKIIGGGLGMALGGPLGAMIGASLGHTFVDSKPGGGRGGVRLSNQETKQMVFFTTTFAMLGKMAKADGRVSPEEVRVVEEFIRTSLKMDDPTRKFAISIFNKGKDDPTPFKAYAEQFGEVFAGEDQVRFMLFELLCTLAMADGTLHPAEDKLLQEAMGPLRIPRDIYDRVRGKEAPDLNRFYSVLGVSPEATDQEIKTAYRKAAKEYHPDTIVSKGLPEEFNEFAETKFKEINTAYETLTKARSKGGA